MKLTFLDNPPKDIEHAILISGETSLNLPLKTYLNWEVGDLVMAFFEIRYDCHCSPFREAIIEDLTLAVGHEGNFYLFSLNVNKPMLSLQLRDYFGHLYFSEDFFYVADAGGLYCINHAGEILWHNNNLGTDGVIINDFAADIIQGSGEWDPHGGWKDFTLDKQTGLAIKGAND